MQSSVAAPALCNTTCCFPGLTVPPTQRKSNNIKAGICLFQNHKGRYTLISGLSILLSSLFPSSSLLNHELDQTAAKSTFVLVKTVPLVNCLLSSCSLITRQSKAPRCSSLYSFYQFLLPSRRPSLMCLAQFQHAWYGLFNSHMEPPI